jgi:hypothetical protein
VSALHPNIAFLLSAGAPEAAGSRRPHPAVVERSGVTHYASLQRRAAAIGAALLHAGVQPNETLRPRQIGCTVSHAGAAALLTWGDIVAGQPRAIATSPLVQERSG